MEKFVKDLKLQVIVCFGLAFLVWISCFWGFLTSHLMLTSDAISYYDHIKFYVESLAHGIFPLWDPFFNGMTGVANDFFLRRIGPYNPLYVFMAFFVKVGVPYRLVYLWGMVFYYFSAAIAFYLTTMHIYKNRAAAFSGSMVLLFSALGTRIFDSYMILIVVPLMWFIFFCVSFFSVWKKWAFVGLVLSLGILLTTYIPFYFLVFLFIALGIYVLIYFKSLSNIFKFTFCFCLKHKMLVVGALMLILLSLVPTVMFSHSASQSQVVIPGRHGAEAGGDQLQVGYNLASDWGIPEDLFYSSYFSNLKRIRFAVVYFPIFALCVLGVGLANQLRKSTLFIFLTGFSILAIFVPHLFPLHKWLFEHVSFFKYFRNLHFFLWFMLIPLMAFLVSDQLSIFLDRDKKERSLLYLIGAIHLGLLIFLVIRGDQLWSNYVSVFLSAAFFIAYIKFEQFKLLMVPGLLVLILIQPMEVYSYFAKNVFLYEIPYDYDLYTMKFNFNNNHLSKSGLYVAPYWFSYFYNNTDDVTYANAIKYKLLVFDNQRVFNTVDEFLDDSNVPMSISKNSNMVKVVDFNANNLSVQTNFKEKKFLVYNDSYDERWKVTINKSPAQLYRANLAFKGVWVPSGNAMVTFTYGANWYYGLNLLLVIAYLFLFGGLFLFRIKENEA